MRELIFLKLGGSLITDKTGVESVRADVLARVAAEIATARQEVPNLKLLLGHGSGSFGHVAAAAQNTRKGVETPVEWAAFARVSDAAARLNRAVIAALLAAGVPAVSLQPSSSARCTAGELQALAVDPVNAALEADLLPVVYGDVAFDTVRGGTIVSTEELFVFLAKALQPSWFLLAGETAGVLDEQGHTIGRITTATLPAVLPALGGSRGTDVTGGMIGKVRGMLDLVQTMPALHVRIFSGLRPQALTALLTDPTKPVGTEVASANPD